MPQQRPIRRRNAAPRFSTNDFSAAVPVPWSPSLAKCVRGFQCIYPQFGRYFRDQVSEDERFHLSRCWMIIDNGHLVAYITLRGDSMRYRDERGNEKIISMDDGDFIGPPAIRIALLAADKRAKGSGKALVEWALDFIAENIAPKVGARFVMVDAYYDSAHKDKNGKSDPWDSSRIYRKLGFQYVNPNEQLPPKDAFRSMFFDLKRLLD